MKDPDKDRKKKKLRQKVDPVNEPPINTRKPSTDKHETMFIDKIRNGGIFGGSNCGICGSSNILVIGVQFCTKCGKEQCFEIKQNKIYTWRKDYPKWALCNCKEEKQYTYKGRKKIIFIDTIKTIETIECIDCKSVRSRYCPVCIKNYNNSKLKYYANYCWQSPIGDIHCTHCRLMIKAKDRKYKNTKGT